MTFSAAELINWINGFLWPFFRIGAMMMTAPIFATQGVPVRIRLMLTLAITFVAVPLVPQVPDVAPLSLAAASIVVQQVLIGISIGLAFTLVFNTIITGGQVIALKMGLGFASMVDPQNGQQIPLVSNFYFIMAMLLFLTIDGHLLLIELIVDSFRVLPVSAEGIGRGGIWELITWGSQMFRGAIWMAVPALAALLVVNLAFGVMARAAPQLNIFVIGFPLAIAMGFAIILFSLPVVLPQFTAFFQDGFELAGRMLRRGE